ncbi:hypothetical protein IFR05_008554 [Cadophora sp. M221]|nr:hypothetical protein IFR05_008554 [Cadophora sp. M221]
MFTRLDMASSQIVITRPLLLDDCQITRPFESASPIFEEINTMLSEILNAGFKLVRISWMCPVGALYDELRQRHLQELQGLRAALETWSREFQNFQNRQGKRMDPWILQRVPVLKIIQIIIAIILDVEPAEAREYGEMVWDRYEADFESVISIAESIIDEARISSPLPGRIAPKFTPETGFVNPLFCVVNWCRNPQLRRKALDILDRAACRDGFWDSSLCTRTGNIILMLEERDSGAVKCAADIPLWKRICVIEPKFAEDGGGALIKYMRASKSGERDEDGLTLKEVFEETVRW